MNKSIPFLNNINELCEKYDTPLQVYDEKLIRNNVNNLIHKFNNKFNFKQFFAVKALPNPHILKILIEEGCGLDCSSISELYIAKKLGVDSQDIFFTSNFTSKQELKYAYDMDVHINLDDISLIDDLYNIYNKFPKKICFRLNPGVGYTNSETKSNVLGGPDAKFGISTDNILEAYKKAKELGCQKYGIHMMTGSCVLDNNYWCETINILLNNMEKIENNLNITFEYINIGGGLGIPYKQDEKSIDIDILVDKIYTILINKKKNLPKLYMENGRYITGPYGWLLSKCNCIKHSFNNIYYGLDACMTHLMRPGMYGSFHYISVPLNKTDKFKISNVVGTLCENNDWFAKNRLIPESFVGDIFVIHDTGAHSHSMGFNYNGKLKAPEILICKDGSFKLIREREEIEDLYKKCNFI